MSDTPRADVPGLLEGMVRSQPWSVLEQAMREELAFVEDELMAMGTEAKRRDELAGYRAGIRKAMGSPAEMIDEIRSERGGDDL